MTPAKRRPLTPRPADAPGVYRCPRCRMGFTYQNPIPAGVNCCRCWIGEGLLLPCIWTQDERK
jgi:hypothetical protein